MTTDSKPVNRRLAAIVVADVVGYTRLMERDEAGTHARLKEIREQVIDRRIREAGGRIISTAGDGMLVEFSSATAALRCAIEIQREMGARNLSLSPDEQIQFRIGINLGDIIIDGQDIAGDGVNVAARLEALAEPGGICISGTVREHARDDLDVGFIDIGEQQVKNMVRPIRVFRVSLEGHPSRIASDRDVIHPARPGVRRWGVVAGLVVLGALAATLALRPSQPPTVSTATTVGPTVPLAPPEVRQLPAMSVAILPFTAPAATLSDQRLADALTRDLAFELARTLRSAKVVADSAVAPYKGKTFDVRAVGRELNVRYLLEGELRRADETLTVNVQLVETGTATQVWSDRVELREARSSKDENDLTAQLTLRLRSAIVDVERRRANATAGSPGSNPMDLVLRADTLRSSVFVDMRNNLEARKLYDEALRIDPSLTPALIGRAWTFDIELINNPRADYEFLVNEFDRTTAKAVILDPRDGSAWFQREVALDWLGRRDAAKEANARARELDRTSKLFLAMAAWERVLDGEPEEALPFLAQARAIDRSIDGATSRVGCVVDLYRGAYATAARLCETAALLGGWWWEHLHLVAAYAQSGDMEKAKTAKVDLLKAKPDFSIASYRLLAARLSPSPGFRRLTEQHVLTGLRKAGVPDQ